MNEETEKEAHRFERVNVLVNRRSGLGWSFDALQRAFSEYWDLPGTDLTYQFCMDPSDGRAKSIRAVEQGVDVLVVVGGDGTVNTVGSALMGSETVMGVVPVGSGNGFGRHFGIPLNPEHAVKVLSRAVPKRIDVGIVDGRPFLVTCSMAWDAALVRSFDRSPVRGILPYVLAGVFEFFDYEPQEMVVCLDTGEESRFDDAVVFTMANLTQYGGGAVIAPDAQPDDGLLELVVVNRQDVPVLIANVGRLINGTIKDLPKVRFERFRSMIVKRRHAAPIQVDGELVGAPRELLVRVEPLSLSVLVPDDQGR